RNFMKKLSEKHKKILKAILIPLIIILVIAMINEIVKYIIISKNDDIIIYRHKSSVFLFSVRGATDSDELAIEIFNYCDRGFLWLDDPFYETYGETDYPRDAVYKKFSIPEEYNINSDNILGWPEDDRFLAREYVYPSEKEQFGLSECNIDFYTCGESTFPQVYFLDSGRKFVIYKKFNYLFLKEIKEEIPEQASAK
ncbi:MAG: hypothetical protein J5992_06900, partial [Oscillospiraceae bacterium]|nr:hypothetical protein [Oscillospiraceae bacterium]